MRRLIVIASLATLLLAAGCGASGTHPVMAHPGTSQHVDPPKVDDSVAVNNYNPCDLVTVEDLKAAYGMNAGVQMMTESGFDPKNPPTNGIDAERSCAYTVTVTGQFSANPTDTTYNFTVIATTYGEDSGGNVWTAMSQGMTMLVDDKHHSIIGDAAFKDTSGFLIAHKGKATLKVWSVDDTDGKLDDAKQATLLNVALARVKS